MFVARPQRDIQLALPNQRPLIESRSPNAAWRVFLSITCVLLLVDRICENVQADVRLPILFKDHMVLQRDMPVAIWGWAPAGKEVTVTFAGQTVKAMPDAGGSWRANLEPLAASAQGRELTVKGNNQLVIKDVIVGDVWICSGQSNMEWGVSKSKNGADELKQANHPGIRLFNMVGHTTSPLPLAKINNSGKWNVCTPSTVGNFSAVGYFFGRTLHVSGKTPIGLIGSNWSGTRIEPWTAPNGFRKVPELARLAAQVDRFDPNTVQGKRTWEQYIRRSQQWNNVTQKTLKTGGPYSRPPAIPGFQQSNQPTAIYNAMIHPLAPFTMRGAIWYQGQSNGSEGIEYYHKMQALVQGWRSVWGRNDPANPFYFYWVQLANYQLPTDVPGAGNGYAGVREAQRLALSIPHTGMAVAIDIGEARDIHPRNKQDVGIRLARWALRDVYQQKSAPSGPLFQKATVERNQIRIHFDYVGGGLIIGNKTDLDPVKEVNNGKLQRFAVAGKDQKWRWAEAKIDGDTVVVSSPDVPAPVAVRYAFSMNPAGANLYNKAGLPASPFRTDDW